MDAHEKIIDLRTRMERNVREGIMPFWRDYMTDEENGGFYGKVNADLTPDKEYPKAIVLNCRMLWAYTMAYKNLGEEKYKDLAKRAFDYISQYFWDETFGGVYWMLNAGGIPLEIEKRTYGQAFIIYSMAAYYQVFGDERAVKYAKQTFDLVNEHVKFKNGGYADSVGRDWRFDNWLLPWMMNRDGAYKLLNSHLHMFEATMALFEATGDLSVKKVLKEFLEFLLNDCVDTNLMHLKAGMDINGNRIDGEVNYGHDAECCYLMTGSARLIGEQDLIDRADKMALSIMDKVLAEGIDLKNGGLYSDADYRTGHVNRVKIWWTQAEGITSFFNCYQLTHDEKYLDAAINIWNYTEKNIVNQQVGEWLAVGKNPISDKELEEQEKSAVDFMQDEIASKAKCPYHNSRTCYEIMRRADEELKNV